MHILIGIITAIAGLVWALNSLQNSGVNLNAFNPFLWLRRRKWERQLGVKPIHALTDSMEVAALLITATAKANGDVTRETKLEILDMFEKEFGVNRKRAIELYSASIYLLQDTNNVEAEIKNILSPSKDSFTPSHITKLFEMTGIVADLDETTQEQLAILKAIRSEFGGPESLPTKW